MVDLPRQARGRPDPSGRMYFSFEKVLLVRERARDAIGMAAGASPVLTAG